MKVNIGLIVLSLVISLTFIFNEVVSKTGGTKDNVVMESHKADEINGREIIRLSSKSFGDQTLTVYGVYGKRILVVSDSHGITSVKLY